MEGNQGRDPSMNVKSRTWIMVAYLQAHVLLAFCKYTSQDHLPRVQCHPQWSKSFYINEQLRDSPIDDLGHSYKENYLIKTSFPVSSRHAMLAINVARRETLLFSTSSLNFISTL